MKGIAKQTIKGGGGNLIKTMRGVGSTTTSFGTSEELYSGSYTNISIDDDYFYSIKYNNHVSVIRKSDGNVIDTKSIDFGGYAGYCKTVGNKIVLFMRDYQNKMAFVNVDFSNSTITLTTHYTDISDILNYGYYDADNDRIISTGQSGSTILYTLQLNNNEYDSYTTSSISYGGTFKIIKSGSDYLMVVLANNGTSGYVTYQKSKAYKLGYNNGTMEVISSEDIYTSSAYAWTNRQNYSPANENGIVVKGDAILFACTFGTGIMITKVYLNNGTITTSDDMVLSTGTYMAFLLDGKGSNVILWCWNTVTNNHFCKYYVLDSNNIGGGSYTAISFPFSYLTINKCVRIPYYMGNGFYSGGVVSTGSSSGNVLITIDGNNNAGSSNELNGDYYITSSENNAIYSNGYRTNYVNSIQGTEYNYIFNSTDLSVNGSGGYTKIDGATVSSGTFTTSLATDSDGNLTIDGTTTTGYLESYYLNS